MTDEPLPKIPQEARDAAMAASRTVSPVPHDEAVYVISDAVTEVWQKRQLEIIYFYAQRDSDQRDELSRLKDLLRQASSAYNGELGDSNEEVLGTILGTIVPDLLGRLDGQHS